MASFMIYQAERQLPVFVVCLLLLVLPGCDRHPTPASEAGKNRLTQLVVPDKGAYTGAYIDFGDKEDAVTLEGIEDFEQEVGKHQAIVAFSSFWGENRFPDEAIHIVAAHGSIPLVFWSPWDWPYREDEVEIHGPDKFSLDTIIAGKWDEYIDRWADAAKAFGQPMYVSLCNEANGNWFPWSAVFYGGGDVVPGSNPPQYKGPELFKQAYRHIVDRVRAKGATNVLWVLHLNNYSEPNQPWNALAQYYPGDAYVDWLGLSVYGQMYPEDERWVSFEDMVDTPYEEIAKLNATKPIMITEWGVGEFPTRGNKADWINKAFERLKALPRVRAAIYWNERWQNNKTNLYSNLKLNSSPGALEAYRRGVAESFWLGNPVYR